MSIPEITLDTLNAASVPYQVLSSDSHESFMAAAQDCAIPMENLARSLLVDSQGKLRLLVLRASDLLDFTMLTALLGDNVEVVSADEYPLDGCEQGTRPPLSLMNSVEIIIDEALAQTDQVYFDSGAKWHFIQVSGRDFCKLNTGAVVSRFSCPPERLYNIDHPEDGEQSNLLSFTPKRIHQRVDETLDLPAMPAIAQEVMRLRIDPNAGAAELAKVVGQDPSLAAQVISWASSPYYGYQGKIDSIQTAISRVLGFDLVLNLALGISVGKTLNVSDDGPLGLRAYWRQSVYCAALCEKLCSFIRHNNMPSRGLVYLSGLLHNFGQLILGHLFPPQFYLINHYVSMNPHIPLVDIERYLLGTTHVEIGEWLMTSWHMPPELISAVRWHHHEDTCREHAIFANLVLVANRLLKRIEIGDASQLIIPESILSSLGIEEEDAFKALDLIVADEHELNAIAQQMVA